ncbi:MAG: hypothetical protein KBB55_01605 [Candidatus Buchananbacteria bacterium]|nr:hypothetical protein [Candidatus Buchananbacteria bacterium]
MPQDDQQLASENISLSEKLQRHHLVIYGILVAIIILLAAALLGVILVMKTNSSQVTVTPYDRYTPPTNTSTSTPDVTTTTPEIVTTELLNVAWAPKLIQQPGDPKDSSSEKYLAGTITSGEYANQQLYLDGQSGMGGRNFSYYIIKDGAEIRLNEDVRIAGISDLPEMISLQGTNYQLKKHYRPIFFSEAKLVKKVFTDPVLGDVWLTQEGCLMVELPDHTAQVYEVQLPFANKENGSVALTFTNGQTNQESYQYNRIIGCGALCYYLAVVDEKVLNPTQRLVAVGKTANGETMYKLKDSNDAALKALYADKNTVAYYSDDWKQSPQNKYTYEQFIAYNPLMYWKDPLGRWIEFKNQRFIIAAEMCKPVIYLYPEATTRLEVKVSPNGGFTYTNPPYHHGWNVEATPEGIITDLRTGQKYDYLFWEGMGMNYPVDKDKGWVVKREELSAFFDRMLPTLGLQGREITDFKEYWVNRLSEQPYYHLTFLKQTQFDEIAPLNLAPIEPQSVIRIMMTAEGLKTPKKVAPQVLEPPVKRTGFTLIEWGGVVLK